MYILTSPEKSPNPLPSCIFLTPHPGRNDCQYLIKYKEMVMHISIRYTRTVFIVRYFAYLILNIITVILRTTHIVYRR